jgi:hypothetical protein
MADLKICVVDDAGDFKTCIGFITHTYAYSNESIQSNLFINTV